MDLDYRPLYRGIQKELIRLELEAEGHSSQEAMEIAEDRLAPEKSMSFQTPPTKDKGKTIPSCEIQPTTNWTLVLLWVVFLIGSIFLIWHFWG